MIFNSFIYLYIYAHINYLSITYISIHLLIYSFVNSVIMCEKDFIRETSISETNLYIFGTPRILTLDGLRITLRPMMAQQIQ